MTAIPEAHTWWCAAFVRENQLSSGGLFGIVWLIRPFSVNEAPSMLPIPPIHLGPETPPLRPVPFSPQIRARRRRSGTYPGNAQPDNLDD